MKSIKLNIRDIINFLIMCLVGIILVFLGMVFVGNNPEKFNDIIIETVAYYGTNETGELSVFWCVLFIGIPLLLILNYFLNRKKNNETSQKELKPIIAIEIVTSIANIIFYIIQGYFNSTLIMVSIISFINYIINPDEQKKRINFKYYNLLFLIGNMRNI